jgi:DNA-binding CsgD family transcriptional regulator
MTEPRARRSDCSVRSRYEGRGHAPGEYSREGLVNRIETTSLEGRIGGSATSTKVKSLSRRQGERISDKEQAGLDSEVSSLAVCGVGPGALGEDKTRMRNFTIEANRSSDGFLLLDSHLNPLFLNHTAAQILIYPRELQRHKIASGHLAGTIRSMLVSKQPSGGSPLVPRFQSGRRQYLCRSFKVGAVQSGDSEPSVAVILERASTPPPAVAHCFEEYNLTTREQAVVLLLSQGLTSKEIGMRLDISPNTVKAFLRIIMVKMGVSTRSGIVGRALSSESSVVWLRP